MVASAQKLSSASFDGSDECGKMPDEFDRFVQDQLESFHRMCDADFEKMEDLEQVSLLLR